WELVDGWPVLKFDRRPEGMAGASNSHDQIVVNLIALLRAHLRGGPCRAKTADQASRMARGNIRYPDVTIDCGRQRPGEYETSEPTVFFEVLSPSTRGFDLLRKADEYRAVPTLRHLVMLEPDRAEAMIWTRDAEGRWPQPLEVKGLDGAVALPAVGVTLPMAEVYEDVTLGE
ncbi:Uma2 family endonuclease, partial [Phenylobacterium sp.]|uniref:Uma2 family endonuclease n=1 Tax=Phenylobacterium sp. TaxID=1871053 RepID=UPI00286C4F7A